MGWAWPIAEYVINCESRWNPGVAVIDRNGYYARGLWQINDQYHAHFWSEGYRWDDPADNTKVAIILYRKSGWSPWSYCARFWNGSSP
jgi:hypothetical protein